MNRRVLLIDADIAFRDTLTQELGRFKVVVITEPEADRALALANADPPSLIVLCIEEADKKAGYRVFEKCKKGALSKVPIILVTSSVPPESFAKHRTIKVHADDYIDKRTMSTHELIGKIDGLIALGEPQEDDLSIPIEDEIPMEIADGDVVLDEVVGDNSAAHEFDPHSANTVGPGQGVSIQSVMEAETDAAFDALLGDEPGPRPVQPAAPVPQAAMPHAAMPDPVFEEPAGVVPEPIHDGRGRGTTPPPLHSSVPGIIHDQPASVDTGHHEPASAAAHQTPAHHDEPAHHEEPSHDHESASDDAGQIHDEAPMEDFHDVSMDSLDQPLDQALDHALDHATDQPLDHDEPPMDAHAADDEAPQQTVIEPMPDRQPESSGEHDSDVVSSGYDSMPSIPLDDLDMVSLDEEMPVEVEAADPAPAAPHVEPVPPEPIAAAPAAPTPRPKFIDTATVIEPGLATPKAGSGSHPAIDLGLDKLAQDAESEQSGVYDRRALRKIGELERQISQLKVELERARAAGDSAAKGASREAQFLNLRESMLAKDKELKQVKGDLVSRDQELAEAREKLRQAQHAKGTLEQKNSELETRLLDDSGKSSQLVASARASAAQLTTMQQELDAMAKAHGAAEAARAQIERDLANERATGAASASEAERLLRVEREQLITRHKNELGAVKSEAQTAHDLALAQVREELDNAHGVAVKAALDEAARTAAQAHQQALGALERTHASEMVALKADHAGAHSTLRNELGGEVARLEAALSASQAAHQDAIASHEAALAQAETALAQADAAHRQAVAAARAAEQDAAARAQSTSQNALAAVHEAHEETLAEQAAAHATELADIGTAHAVGLEELRRTHAAEVAELQANHVSAVAARDDHHEEARDREAESHGRALAELKAELGRTVASHEVKLGAAKRELAEVLANHEQARAELDDQHRNALAEAAVGAEGALADAVAAHRAEVGRAAAAHQAELAKAAAAHQAELAKAAAAHQAELAKLRTDHEQLGESSRRAADSHRAALAETQSTHAAELASVTETAAREVAEHKAAAATARRHVDETTAKLTAERETATKVHDDALADLIAKHERALALANGEASKRMSIAEAEHAKVVSTHQAATEKVRTELSAERDELKRGLSSARDTLRRSESELASAVQSIADRNAELRSHGSAIAERDQRIAELRKEIEALETENTSYQEQVLRAYQKIKADEAMVARARKAMAIALTVLDDEGKPKET